MHFDLDLPHRVDVGLDEERESRLSELVLLVERLHELHIWLTLVQRVNELKLILDQLLLGLITGFKDFTIHRTKVLACLQALVNFF